MRSKWASCPRLSLCRSSRHGENHLCPLVCEILELGGRSVFGASNDSEIGQAIMDGRCLNVIEIDSSLQQFRRRVRDLRDECRYRLLSAVTRSSLTRFICSVSRHSMRPAEDMEEPLPHAKFVFATTESHKVLPTIVSRCQRFEFRSIPVPLIIGKLEEICKTDRGRRRSPRGNCPDGNGRNERRPKHS